jgi:hypothetical protein
MDLSSKKCMGNVPWWSLSSCAELVKSLCRSDPTENDSVEGLRPNARGPGLVTFGVSAVSVFLHEHCFHH